MEENTQKSKAEDTEVSMSSNLTAFEVRVSVKGNKSSGYNSANGCYCFDETIKMFHKWARTAKQAMDRCRKYGKPISVRKVDVSVMYKDFEKLPLLNDMYNSHAIALDEMIWRKRNGRGNNMHKDKRWY